MKEYKELFTKQNELCDVYAEDTTNKKETKANFARGSTEQQGMAHRQERKRLDMLKGTRKHLRRTIQ